MRIRRLGWAGVELEQEGTKIAIDPIATLGYFEDFLGEESARDRLVQLEPGSLAGVLLTHLHRDHVDPEGLVAALAPACPVIGPPFGRTNSPHQQYAVEPQEAELRALGIERQVAQVGDSVTIGPFRATACLSVDGVGAAQVAWLVQAGGDSVLHCGDTVWHGGLWEIAAEHGGPDIACLAANGAIVDFPFNQPPAARAVDMGPEEAVDAASVLRAQRMLPIHFSRTYDHETMYRPTDDVRGRLERAAAQRQLTLVFPEIGEWTEVAAGVPA